MQRPQLKVLNFYLIFFGSIITFSCGTGECPCSDVTTFYTCNNNGDYRTEGSCICFSDIPESDNHRIIGIGDASNNVENTYYTVGDWRNYLSSISDDPDPTTLDIPTPVLCQGSIDPDPNPGSDEDSPYIISELDICYPGGGFRTSGTGGHIKIEDCDDATYYIDTKNLLDQTGSAGFREIYIGFSIQNFDPFQFYGLFIKDENNIVIFKYGLTYHLGNPRIVHLDPKVAPNNADKTITGTIKANILINAPNLASPQKKTYTVSISPNWGLPNETVPGIDPVTFELNNRYSYEGQVYKERVMNIKLYGNSGSTFDSNIRDYAATTRIGTRSFKQAFEDVWQRSDIHLLPNYLPSIYEPSVSVSGIPNANPINTDLPEYLVDKEGNVVLLETDWIKANEWRPNGTDDEYYEFLMKEWRLRLQFYNNVVDHEPERVNTLQKLLYSVGTSEYGYQNKVGLVVTNSVKVYKEENLIDDDILIDVTSLYTLPSGTSISDYRANSITIPAGTIPSGTVPMGVTTYYDNPVIGYNPFIIVDRGVIALILNNIPDIDGKCIATAMHELAHAWYISGTNDMSKTDYYEQHAAYCRGSGDAYCLMRSARGGTTMINLPTPAQREKYIKDQTYQMQFSDGLQQRLANVFSLTN